MLEPAKVKDSMIMKIMLRGKLTKCTSWVRHRALHTQCCWHDCISRVLGSSTNRSHYTPLPGKMPDLAPVAAPTAVPLETGGHTDTALRAGQWQCAPLKCDSSESSLTWAQCRPDVAAVMKALLPVDGTSG